MNPARLALCLAFSTTALVRLAAADRAAELKSVASHVLKLHELVRIVDDDNRAAPNLRRITIVAKVVETAAVRGGYDRPGDTIVIDYTVDLARRAAAEQAHREKADAAPRLFVHEPDAPALDARKEFWAHLAPAGGRLGNANRQADAVIALDREEFSANVFVPVAAQFSWDPPEGHPRAPAETTPPADTITGTVRTGIMAIGGETTGIVLETPWGDFELDVRGDEQARAKLEALNGKPARITGALHVGPGVEVKERRIIAVRAIAPGQ